MKAVSTLKTPRPEWAQALIVAERREDRSDLMTDYHASVTAEVIALAWSHHTKDLFSEMRKAAELLPQTHHLGRGCDVWTARVVLANTVNDRGFRYYCKGDRSHWHDDRMPAETFQREADARTYAKLKGDPESISFGEGQIAQFEWSIAKTSIEHREKYSMGAGYYLSAGSRHSDGWIVRKYSGMWGGLPETFEYIDEQAKAAGEWADEEQKRREDDARYGLGEP